MPEDRERHSRLIYHKLIDIEGRDYAFDLYDGEIPSLSEGDREILRDRGGIYNVLVVRKEQDDKKCDRDRHYCHTHKRCERDDHDCDDKKPCPPCPDPDPDGHDSEIDRKILEEINDQATLLRRIISDVENDRDRDIDRKILQICNIILNVVQSTPTPTPTPIPTPTPTPIPTPTPTPTPVPTPTPTPVPTPTPQQSKTRVIIHGEVDVPTQELNEEDKPQDPKQQDQIVASTVADLKSKYPKLKITGVLVARGSGPAGPVW